MTAGTETNTTKPKDEFFKNEIKQASDFKFGSKVAGVFDDMVNRSVPFYGEMQRMIAELAADHALEGTNVYDLGCSTGTTLIGMNALVADNIRFVGIDESKDMLDKCHEKLSEIGITRPYELITANLQEGFNVENASVAVLCLTLQFIRPVKREKILKSVFDGLQPGGVLILVEKILAEESLFNRNFIKYYYDMKRRHNYSEMEISQKERHLKMY